MTGFTLKLIGIMLMLMDHIHYMFPQLPLLMTQLGRLCAPIFIFMTANGMRHTRNPKKYMLRLYVASILMAMGNQMMMKWFPLPNDVMIMNNIFATLFLTTFMIFAIDRTIHSIKAKAIGKSFLFLLMSLVPLLLSVAMIGVLNSGNIQLLRFFMMFIPTLLTVEGGFIFVLLGVGFYYTSGSKQKTVLFYFLFCIFVFFITTGSDFSAVNLFKINFQWLMVFSLPLIAMYNGEKGRDSKWFFYFFYPAHIYVLAIIAHYL